MITLEQYAGKHSGSEDWTEIMQANAVKLLRACNSLESRMLAEGVAFPVNPKTGSQISGETMGGFRPQWCKQGVEKSSHKIALAVDRYDPHGHIDTWLIANSYPRVPLSECVLTRFGIYIERPDYTVGWSHWGIKLSPNDSPKSGNHVFKPY